MQSVSQPVKTPLGKWAIHVEQFNSSSQASVYYADSEESAWELYNQLSKKSA